MTGLKSQLERLSLSAGTLRPAQHSKAKERGTDTDLRGFLKKAMKKSELEIGKRACLALRCARHQVIQGEGGE